MKLPAHKPFALALLLGGMSCVGIGLVSLVFHLSHATIAQNQQNALVNTLQQLLTTVQYDNDLLQSRQQVNHLLLGDNNPKSVYFASYQGRPVATLISCVAPDGYNGNIVLLVAIKPDNSLIAVRVVAHRETPGLGDGIEIDRADWITQFNRYSLQNLVSTDWAVKREGGKFDQLTGATITSRAVINAVHNALFFAQTYTKNTKTTVNL